ncbi:TolC family protein [Hymenobacter latericus]|uniref:TolC family protein n=1 Tax=Hymenobacter sp. YIM 151858-1 TaxID=2987688 RepID=UPI002226BA01|nr:TolC family protein [Hymenobacter sp. YIM 151858-1]UYZ61173.1 TolC family protein [Hymenobacter sp. YIM 151858-1]
MIPTTFRFRVLLLVAFAVGWLRPLLTQAQVLSLDSAVARAERQHPRLRQAARQLDEQRALKRGSFSLPNPDLLLDAPSGYFYTFGAVQTIQSPAVYRRQAKQAQAGIELASRNQLVQLATVRRDVRRAYVNLQYAEAVVRQLTQQDSLYQRLYVAVGRLHAAGEIDLLQKVSTEAEARQVANLLTQARTDLQAAQQQLGLLIGQGNAPELATTSDLRQAGQQLATQGTALLAELPTTDSSAVAASPTLSYYQQTVRLSQSGISLVRAQRAPALTLGYLNQAEERNSPYRYRFQVGLSVPLWFWTYRSQLQAATARAEAASAELDVQRLELSAQYRQAVADVRKFNTSLGYYQQTGLPQARTIIGASQRLFQAGEVSYLVLFQSLRQAFDIQTTHLTTLRDYGQALVELNYLRGQ